MNPFIKKRFWKSTEVTDLADGFGVALDGRVVKTPAKVELTVPSRDIAKLIALEWDAVEGVINPETMRTTRWANAAIDKVSAQRDGVIEMLAEYGGSDLLCYRSAHPEELFLRQQAKWDPVLKWAASHLEAPLETTRGVLPVAQPNQSLAKMKQALEALDSYELAAIHDLVTISGSLVLALALSSGELSVADAWEISRVDEEWQIMQWGTDDEAVAEAAAKYTSFEFAHQMLGLLRQNVRVSAQ